MAASGRLKVYWAGIDFASRFPPRQVEAYIYNHCFIYIYIFFLYIYIYIHLFIYLLIYLHVGGSGGDGGGGNSGSGGAGGAGGGSGGGGDSAATVATAAKAVLAAAVLSVMEHSVYGLVCRLLLASPPSPPNLEHPTSLRQSSNAPPRCHCRGKPAAPRRMRPPPRP